MKFKKIELGHFSKIEKPTLSPEQKLVGSAEVEGIYDIEDGQQTPVFRTLKGKYFILKEAAKSGKLYKVYVQLVSMMLLFFAITAHAQSFDYSKMEPSRSYSFSNGGSFDHVFKVYPVANYCYDKDRCAWLFESEYDHLVVDNGATQYYINAKYTGNGTWVSGNGLSVKLTLSSRPVIYTSSELVMQPDHMEPLSLTITDEGEELFHYTR